MELLSGSIGIYRTGRNLKLTSFITASIIICIGLIFLKKSVYNISWIAVGIYLVFCIFGTKKETALMNMRNLLFKRARIIKYGIIPVREIAVMKNLRVSEALRGMDNPGYFHIISILDEDLKVIGVITEQEILEMLTNNGSDVTFDSLLTTSKQ